MCAHGDSSADAMLCAACTQLLESHWKTPKDLCKAGMWNKARNTH